MGFGLELFLTISKEGSKQIPEAIELPDEKRSYVVIEGRQPTCFECGQKGHIKERCPFEWINNDKEEEGKTKNHEEIEVNCTEVNIEIGGRKRTVTPPKKEKLKEKKW